MDYTVDQLAQIINAEVIGNDIYRSIIKIFYDSRNITDPSNGIFFAIKGIHDGHIYMEEAYQKSIRVFICSHIMIAHEDAIYLIVKDPLEALQQWAACHLSKYNNLKILGITGSNGKTIVKEWLYQCIWDQFDIVRSPKSFNSQIGLPLSVLQVTEENTLGIFEVGISQPKEMEKQEAILHPAIGVLTNVAEAHSAYFESLEEHIAEKLLLFKNTEIIIYNNEREETERQVREKYSDRKLISFGSKNSDIFLVNKHLEGDRAQIKISVFGSEEDFIIPFTDDASIQDILCLVGILYSIGFDVHFMKDRFAALHSVSMRLELVKGLNNCLIINDAFNSDYESLEIALNFLFQQNKTQKVLILSDIFQSHWSDEELYHKISKLVNSFPLEQVLLIGESLKKYKKLFLGKVHAFTHTQECIHYLENNYIKNSAILIKGARVYELEKIATRLGTQSHDTIMGVNLHSLMMNVNYFKSLLKPETKIIAMVKASSYGTGGFEIAEVLQYYHAEYLAVAYADEGALLREKGIYLPIMVMNPEVSSYDVLIDNKMEPEIYSFRVLDKFIQKLKEKSIAEKYPIHIKIDTGMHRLGFQPEEAKQLAEIIQNNPFVEVKSVFSHFAVSNDLSQEEYTRFQAEKLQYAYAVLTEILPYKPMLHISNTCGIINYPEYQFDAVRIGIGMYGYIDHEKAMKKLETVVTLKTVISNLHTLKSGETVGYGRRFKVEKDSVIATLPVGYADGIRRSIGNGVGYVCINGKKAPIIGSICMDMLMVNVTDIPCEEGDTVILLGESPSLKEYSEWYNTIPYEVLTSISPRVKRVYYRE